MSIGTRIREARKRARMTQAQLASKVGMAQGSLSELETGESEATTLTASFAAALGVNALWLETGKGEMVTATAADSAAFFDSIRPGEIDLLTMYRLANTVERQVFEATANDVRDRLLSEVRRRQG